MHNIIEIKGLVKKFGNFTAVNGIDLKINENEIFGVLGPNGAGKTTTISLMLGILKPTAGTIKIAGLDVLKHEEEIKNIIGFMTQETVVEADLTAAQNLQLFCELYHVDKKEVPERVKIALEDSGLVAFANTKAGTFSGGMQRRLSLVRSMMHNPRILILDEPTTGLDVQNRVEMWRRIKELKQKGMTIILTTQYLEEADELCDKIAIIDHGKIKAEGTPSELKAMIGKGNVLEIVSDTQDAQKIAKMIETKFRIKSEVVGEKISAPLLDNGVKIFNQIVSEISKSDYKVFSIGMHLPTLDDVFIKLTGSSLRDSVGENTSQISRARMMSRR
ncbi:MAG: ATP-binding cassette domain-containing protein [Candidatus Micrarchaeaceae archaeon]